MAVYCRNCGIEVDENTNFCPQCGASIYGDADAAAYSNSNVLEIMWQKHWPGNWTDSRNC